VRGLFVTGTDTGVGKTVACAALMHRFRGARYWKPIQTGIEYDNDTNEVQRLGSCTSEELLDEGVRLRRALSPHLAARLDGRPIDLERLMGHAVSQAVATRWIVEGAGGVLVPINDSALMVDLIAALGLPVLVVARTRLGTINHTLLTLEALRAKALMVVGVLMVGEPDRENRAAIETYGRVSVVGELPFLDPLTPATLGAWARVNLDAANQLPLTEPRTCRT